MEQRPHSPCDHEAVLRVLEASDLASVDPPTLAALAIAIVPYVERTRLPFEDAVPRIAKNYLCYGERVGRLLASPDTPEWYDVLERIIDCASKHALFPRDTEAVSAPDLDAYNEIRLKLGSYNFEGSFESWMTAVVLARLRRYWRDQQTLAAGGLGIKTKAERMLAQGEFQRRAPNASLVSLDWLVDKDDVPTNDLAAHGETVAEAVEVAELRTLILHELTALALRKNDPLMVHVWNATIEQGLKLREAAAGLGLTVAQVHRRVVQARQHLRQSPQIVGWRDARLL